jgi:hypothetical protein
MKLLAPKAIAGVEAPVDTTRVRPFGSVVPVFDARNARAARRGTGLPSQRKLLGHRWQSTGLNPARTVAVNTALMAVTTFLLDGIGRSSKAHVSGPGEH